MFSYREFYLHMQKYDADFITRVALNDEALTALTELILSEMREVYEKHKIISNYDNDLSITEKSIFESEHFMKYVEKELKKEVERSKNKNLFSKILNRSYNCIRDFHSQKRAMIENKSRYADFDLIMTAIDTSDEREISQMYITVKALQDKLDEKTYLQLRKRAKEKFRSCRIPARYFLYVLRKIIEDKKEIEEPKNVKIENIKYVENQKETKEKKKSNSKTEKKIDKSIEIHTSEADYKRYKKNEKLDKETRYKLYLYRIKYQDELKNTKLKRLSKDHLLFFLINTEKFNETLTLNKILKIIKYADYDPKIKNPVGWLIERFQIEKGRFYFLLRKSKKQKEQKVEKEKSNSVEQEKRSNSRSNSKSKENFKDIYINGDLAYFIQKYNIPENEVLSYLSKFEVLHGDVSYIVERYVANKIWKNLSKEERQKLIIYAQREIKRFAVPPKSKEEFQEEIKSIIFARIKSDYLTLSIEERLRLQMSGQYDTS
ncbi:MAG TPA: hypothetical protein ENK22_01000 [Persephonella sp.]|nr:hypothetical protein [Persephonella sp.]